MNNLNNPTEDFNEGVVNNEINYDDDDYDHGFWGPKKKKQDNSDAYGFQDPGDMSFGRAAFEKIVTIMLSVKVHIMVSILIISTWLLINGFINGGEWTTVNTTVVSIVVGLRESFKMSAINYKRTKKTNKEKFRQ